MNLVFVEEVKANEFLIVNIITKTFKFGIHRMRPFSDRHPFEVEVITKLHHEMIIFAYIPVFK